MSQERLTNRQKIRSRILKLYKELELLDAKKRVNKEEIEKLIVKIRILVTQWELEGRDGDKE